MKIKDVVIKEGGSGGAAQAQKKAAQQQAATAPTLDDGGGYNPMGDVTSSMPSASPTNVAAAAPKGPAGQAKWPTTAAEIKAFQTANKLKADGLIGAKTMAALQKAGATPPPGFKPVGGKQPAKQPTQGTNTNTNIPVPPPGVVFNDPNADPTKDPYDPNKDTNVKMTPQSEIQAAQSDADKKAAISANLPPVVAPTPPTTGPNVAPTNTAANVPQGGAGPNTSPWGGKPNAPSANAMADFQRLAGITPTVNNQTSSYNQPPAKELPPGLASATTPQGSAENPAGQAAQPQGNPDYGKMNPQDAAAAYDAQLKAQGKPGLEKGQGVVGTGTGTAMTTGTGSPLQYDHSDAMMAWRQAHPMQSPPDHATAKKWYEKELERKAQGQKTADNIKGFLNKINPFASKQQDAGPTGNVNNQSSGYTQPQQESAELAMLRKLSGLK